MMKWINILRNAETEDKDILFFAEHEGKLIGILGAYFNKSPENQGIGNLYGFYVNEAYRGKGIGKELIKKVIERLQTIPRLTKARLMVNKEQIAAKSVYEQEGFRMVGTEKFVLGDGVEHEELIMEKSLQ